VPTVEVKPGVSASDPMRTLLLHTIREQVLVIRQMQREEMRVVVPGEHGTGIQLDLARKDGAVTVAAVCDWKQYGMLQPHWAEMKLALAAQGIELKDLELANGGAGQRQGQQESWGREGEETFLKEEGVESPLVFNMHLPVKGWQQWA
jgi:hypothetical protein